MTILRNLTGAGLPGLAATAINGSAATGLTATGTTLATAYYMSSDVNVFSTVASSTGAVLPTPGAGDKYVVQNNGASTLSVYPPSGATIGNLSASAPFLLNAGYSATFTASSATAYSVSASAGADGTAISTTFITMNATTVQIGGVGITTPVSIIYTPVIPTMGAFFADRKYNISSIVARAAVASSSAATYTFWKASSGTSGLASGVQVSTGVFDLQSGALVNRFIAVNTGTASTLATGDVLGWVLAGASETAYGSVTFNLNPT